MKKSYFMVLVGILSVLLVSGCASVNKDSLAKVQSAALVSVYCDRAIDMSDFGGLATMAQQLAKSNDFDLQPLAERLRDDVFQNYAPLFPFQFMTEDKVLANPDYQAVQAKQTTSAWSQALPKGYVLVSPIQTDQMKRLATTLGADASMILQATYKLSKDEGPKGLFGKARVSCSLWLILKDSTGKEVFSRMDFDSSKTWVAYALNFVPNTKSLLDMCQEATDNASATMKAWLTKVLK